MLRTAVFLVGALGVAASALADDIVATRTLRIGSVLKAADLHAKNANDSKRLEAMIGMELRRVIYSGRPISEADLGPPTLVKRNDVVVMTFSSGGLEMRTEGRALSRGGVGETIEVMTLSSRQKVRAIVRSLGRVEVRR